VRALTYRSTPTHNSGGRLRRNVLWR
jgi:hypothetical protein